MYTFVNLSAEILAPLCVEYLIINGVNLIPRALSLPRLRKTGETGNYVTCNDEIRKIFSQGSIKLKLKINICNQWNKGNEAYSFSFESLFSFYNNYSTISSFYFIRIYIFTSIYGRLSCIKPGACSLPYYIYTACNSFTYFQQGLENCIYRWQEFGSNDRSSCSSGSCHLQWHRYRNVRGYISKLIQKDDLGSYLANGRKLQRFIHP